MATILIIDDDDAMRGLLIRALGRSGHSTIPAASGLAALELVEAEAVDLVVTDIYMAGMDGIELIRRLRSAEYDGPILAISGNARASSRSLEDARLLGADATLEKPFSLTQLDAAVDALLEPGAG